MLRQICTAIIAVSVLGTASAETVVLHNVHGYTPTRTGMQSFTGIIIEDGRVRACSPTMTSRAAPSSTAAASTSFPGLTDAHGHVLGLGELKLQADLRGTTSIDDALRASASTWRQIPARVGSSVAVGIRSCGRQALSHCPGARRCRCRPSRNHDARRRPCELGEHRCAEGRGITASTPDPQGGQIVRDASGQPTGVLVDTAQDADRETHSRRHRCWK
jgi:predicted amidohydrolase YtcJ